MAATRDGFVIGDGDGIWAWSAAPHLRHEHSPPSMIAINTIAVSSDGRFIAAGNSFGAVEVWELR
jgi:hypothetical protein